MGGMVELWIRSLRRLWWRPWHTVSAAALMMVSMVVGTGLHARLHAAEEHRLASRQLAGLPVWSVESVQRTALDRLRAEAPRISVSRSALQNRFPTIFLTSAERRVEPSSGRVVYTLPVLVRLGAGAPSPGHCAIVGVPAVQQAGFQGHAWLQGTVRCRVVWDESGSPLDPLRKPHVSLSVQDAPALLGLHWYRNLGRVLVAAPNIRVAETILAVKCTGSCSVLPAWPEHTPKRSLLVALSPISVPMVLALLMGLLLRNQRQPIRLEAALAMLHGNGRGAVARHALLQGFVQAILIGFLCTAAAWLVLCVIGDTPSARVAEAAYHVFPAILVASAIAVASMLPDRHSLLQLVKENS